VSRAASPVPGPTGRKDYAPSSLAAPDRILHLRPTPEGPSGRHDGIVDRRSLYYLVARGSPPHRGRRPASVVVSDQPVPWMPMNRIVPLFLVALLATPCIVRAQCPATTGGYDLAPNRVDPLPGPRIRQAEACARGWAARANAEVPTRDLHPEGLTRLAPTPRRSLMAALGGAVIGAWIGYFASQVAVSDWDVAASKELDRGAWAIGGAVAGGLGGLILGRGKRGEVTTPGAMASPSPRTLILRDEIARAGAPNALALVQALRSEWLVVRGANSFRETARGTTSGFAVSIAEPGKENLVVYLDDARLGGPETLAQITVESIQYIQYLDASAATYRWGAGHSHGAILVSTRPLP